MASLKNLAAIKAAGGVVPAAPIKVDGVWERYADDQTTVLSDTFDVWVYKQSLGRMADLHELDLKDRNAVAMALSKTVAFENDKGRPEQLSYDDAYMLELTLAHAILACARKINPLPKALPPKTSSSANSSLQESAEAPSKKPESALA
jgi:hypothetical protein